MGKPTSYEKQCIEEGFTPVQREVRADFRNAFTKAFPELADSNVEISISTSSPQHGDYQCNNAMGLFKRFGKTYPDLKKPKDFGDKIAEALSTEHFAKIDVAPAGYVTVTLKVEWLSAIIEEAVLKPEEVICSTAKRLRVCIDYSAPNIAKEMHVGHLRSTIQGESIARLLEYVGHTVDRTNHVGDWGTQFGMLIQYMSEVYPALDKLIANQDSPDVSFKPDIGDLNAFYKKAKFRFDEDAEFKTRARNEVVKLQSGDPRSRAAWQLLIKISMDEFEKVYSRLGISNLLLRGESFYNDLIPKVVKLCEGAGQIEVVEGGAKCAFENPPDKRKNEVPLMLVKSDGGYGYDSTDAACIYYRLQIEKYDWAIYITDSGQEEHILKVFRLAERMGWNPGNAARLDHCGLGLVCGDDGKKFKSRSGEAVKLADLLDEAVRRAEKELRERRDDVSDEEVKVNAAKIGYAAVKYFDMNQIRTGNYQFSYDLMLDPKGNTAVYLFYAYARVCSIFRKCPDVDESSLTRLSITEESERKLLRHLVKFPVALEAVLEEMSMHKICSYSYDLCTIFSEFYRDCRIVDHEKKIPRLALCRAVKRVLRVAFHILGIEQLEKI